METIAIVNEKIKSNPLSVIEINTSGYLGYPVPSHAPMKLIQCSIIDLSKCIHLKKIIYKETTLSELIRSRHHNWAYPMSTTDYDQLDKQYISSKLDLTQCINLTHISLTNMTISLDLTKCINLTELDIRDTSISLDLTKCINLTHISLTNMTISLDLTKCINLTELDIRDTSISLDLTKCIKLMKLTIHDIIINDIDLTKCINLTHFTYSGNDNEFIHLLDFSKCIKLQSFTSNYNNLNLRLFPDIIHYIGQDKLDNVYHLRQQIKTEERLNKLEEDNRELRKIIDELRPTKSKYM